MKKETVKKLLAPSFYLIVGAVGILLMLLNYAEVNYGVVLPMLSSTGLVDFSGAIGYSAFDAISFGDGSIKTVLELCFLPYAKDVAAPFLLSALAVMLILFAVICAALVIVGIIALVSAFTKFDLFSKTKLDAVDIAAILTRIQVVLLVVCDLLFVFCAFLNLYSIEGNSFVGLKPAVGFYVLTAAFAVAFVIHELYVKKNSND